MRTTGRKETSKKQKVEPPQIPPLKGFVGLSRGNTYIKNLRLPPGSVVEYQTQTDYRFVTMPCCRHQFEWIGTRSPNFCPKCGRSLADSKITVLVFDPFASLTYKVRTPDAKEKT